MATFVQVYITKRGRKTWRKTVFLLYFSSSEPVDYTFWINKNERNLNGSFNFDWERVRHEGREKKFYLSQGNNVCLTFFFSYFFFREQVVRSIKHIVCSIVYIHHVRVMRSSELLQYGLWHIYTHTHIQKTHFKNFYPNQIKKKKEREREKKQQECEAHWITNGALSITDDGSVEFFQF